MKRIISFLLAGCITLLLGSTAAWAAPKRPTVLISKFTTTPNPVVPGKEFTLGMALQNVGDKDALKISVVVNSSGTEGQQEATEVDKDVFSPVESGNTLYIEEIKDGETVEKSIKMIAPGDLEPGVYNLTLTIHYGDSSRGTYDMTQTVGVVVAQEDALKIVSLSYPSEIDAGTIAEISAEVVNLGNGPLKGIQAELTGNIQADEKTQYFGTFESGDNDMFSTDFKADKPGMLNGKLTVSYYDQFNNLKQVSQEITIKVKGEEDAKPVEKKEGGFFSSIVSFFKTLLGIGG